MRGEPDLTQQRRRRREVLDGARRRVERGLIAVEVADELAAAADRLLEAPESERAAALDGLRAALARYRAAMGVGQS
ncbi:MAG TPA: hypothetical protein VF160_09900 [Candidatus Dormibacteraeota bacterium]